MGIFDSGEEHPPAKVRRYIITVVAFVVVVFLFAWYWMGLRFYKERGTVRHFLTDVDHRQYRRSLSDLETVADILAQGLSRRLGPERLLRADKELQSRHATERKERAERCYRHRGQPRPTVPR